MWKMIIASRISCGKARTESIIIFTECFFRIPSQPKNNTSMSTCISKSTWKQFYLDLNYPPPPPFFSFHEKHVGSRTEHIVMFCALAQLYQCICGEFVYCSLFIIVITITLLILLVINTAQPITFDRLKSELVGSHHFLWAVLQLNWHVVKLQLTHWRTH